MGSDNQRIGLIVEVIESLTNQVIEQRAITFEILFLMIDSGQLTEVGAKRIFENASEKTTKAAAEFRESERGRAILEAQAALEPTSDNVGDFEAAYNARKKQPPQKT